MVEKSVHERERENIVTVSTQILSTLAPTDLTFWFHWSFWSITGTQTFEVNSGVFVTTNCLRGGKVNWLEYRRLDSFTLCPHHDKKSFPESVLVHAVMLLNLVVYLQVLLAPVPRI